MSVYVLTSRVSTVEYNVDDLGRKALSVNAVLYGITTINALKADKSSTYTKTEVDTSLGLK
ncbi:MAG: hypothetical protein ACKPKO_17825, partial [Candidatus Fonsibacter sp.]